MSGIHQVPFIGYTPTPTPTHPVPNALDISSAVPFWWIWDMSGDMWNVISDLSGAEFILNKQIGFVDNMIMPTGCVDLSGSTNYQDLSYNSAIRTFHNYVGFREYIGYNVGATGPNILGLINNDVSCVDYGPNGLDPNPYDPSHNHLYYELDVSGSVWLSSHNPSRSTLDVSGRAVITDLSATNLDVSGSAFIADLSATNIYTVDLSASQIFTIDLSATNLDVSGRAVITDLSATNIYTVDLSASRIYTQDLSATDISAIHIDVTDISATNIDATNKITALDISATRMYTVDLSASQIFTTDLSATNIDVSGTLNVTDLSATNIYTVDLSASQIFTIDLSATNLDVSGTLNVTDLSATNIYTVDLSASQIFTIDLSATNLDVSGTLNVTDLSATNIYTVDLSASQIFTIDLSATNLDVSGTLNVTDLSATNIYTVDLSASQIFTIDLSATNLDVSGTLNVNDLSAAILDVTDLSATNIYTVDLSASQIFTIDLSATNIDVSGTLNVNDLSATNIYTVDLSASQIFTIDLSATNIDVSGTLNVNDLSATNIYTVDLSASQIFTIDLSATNIDVSGTLNVNDLSATNIYTIDLSASQIFTTDLSATNVDVSGVLRIGDCPIDVSNGAITLDCSLNLSCNPIVDVSSISFCDDTYVGPGSSSFDISTNAPSFKIKVRDTSNAFVVDQSGNILIGTSNSLYNHLIPSYLYFKARNVIGPPSSSDPSGLGPYICIGGETVTGNTRYQSVINLLTKGNFEADGSPALTNSTKGWHIVAKGDAYQGTYLAGQTGNMLSFYFKNEQPHYISGFHIAGRSPSNPVVDYSGAEIGIGHIPIPGVSLYIDPSDNRGGCGAKKLGAIRIGPVGDESTGELQFMEKSSHGTKYVGFKAPPSITTPVVWALPDKDGSANQVLETDGNGQLSWRDLSNISFNDISVNDISCTNLDVSNNLNIGGDISMNCGDISGVGGNTFLRGDVYGTWKFF